MQRLCERPGCSDVASVAYGMRPEDLVFWLDVLSADADDSVGVLCRRHADAMIVPRDWTLDDLRDPELRLFRPPPADPSGPLARRRSAPRRTDDTEQLELVATDGDGAVAAPPGEPGSWTPAFDTDDDLGGLLAARSPLLSRAFRGEDRSKL
jgi:hypothetical protein